MSSTARKFASAAVVMTLLLLVAWLPAAAEHRADLSRLVVVGDSLSAGFQSGSLLHTQQVHGYAKLIARQAHVPLVLPLIADPGVPPVLQLISVNPLLIAPSIQPIPPMPRLNPTKQATDLAVPGANVSDVLNKVPTGSSAPQDVLTNLVLGFPGLLETPPAAMTQVEWAQTLKPTTIILWIGNNDALGAATNGSDAVTPVADFAFSYAKIMDELATTNATLIIANIPDVTAIPFFVPLDTVAAELGVPVSLLTSFFGLQEGDFVTLDNVALVAERLKTNTPGPLPDDAVLTKAEAAVVSAAIDQYNAIIASEAKRVGATLVDIHALFVKTKARGYVVDHRKLTTDFLGGIFSLDGIHPTNTGYAVVANEFIKDMNRKLGLHIPLVDVDRVAEKDPLILPPIAHPPSGVKKGSLRPMLKMMHH